MIAETALDEQAKTCGSASATPRSPGASPAIRLSAAPPASSTATVSSSIIRKAGYTEARFVAEQRRRDAAPADRQSIAGELQVPQRGA